MRALVDRQLHIRVWHSHRAPTLSRRGNSGPCDKNLRARRLAMDAKRKPGSIDGLAPGIRLPQCALEPLLRADDDLSARHRLSYPRAIGRHVGRMDPS